MEEWPKLVALEKEKNLIGIYLTSHPLDDYRLEIDSFCTNDVTLTDLNNDLNSTGKDFTFGGIVTDSQEGITKNGKPFSFLTLSDYSGSYKFFFFGNDYVNFGNFCKKGLFLLIKGRIGQKWTGSDQLEFKTNKIELLQELSGKAESIKLTLPPDIITNELIDELDGNLAQYQGKSMIKFAVIDTLTNIQIDLFSRTRRVGITTELKAFLQKYPEMFITIN